MINHNEMMVNEANGTHPDIYVNKAEEYAVFEWDALGGIPVWLGNEGTREEALARLDHDAKRLEAESCLFALRIEPGMWRMNKG